MTEERGYAEESVENVIWAESKGAFLLEAARLTSRFGAETHECEMGRKLLYPTWAVQAQRVRNAD